METILKLYAIKSILDIVLFFFAFKRIHFLEEAYMIHSKILHVLVDNLPKKEDK